ncbi:MULTISPECIES: urea transporter [unclassified Pseudomonas]|uniref:urea transporter n=1 Tax=unclassified Pseudomonas TaxID=196821 RepID=UPI000C87A972|nr:MULTISPECIES: urea transporter [unclassified Pseudomonas]PMU10289.1 urea transporter [Pseudomonas sp. FW305-20]PMU21245.1 urea transporter [Pseudomonas sp. FW305-122]PMU40478.1 urea transporter [Pseudomonas sp. FW305-47B]PMX60698.1 urea transporter [Pseudomonas sp. FW305-33]PMX67039.1 urea transporter [Pseudomonas sp. FW305-60]
MPANHFNTHCPDWATALLNGFSQIFLQRHPLCGLLCLLAILFTAPTLLGGALLGGVAGLLTAQRRGYAKADRQAGLFSYNGVLLGLLLSLYFPWSAVLPPLIIAAGGLSAMVTQQWLKRVRISQYLPAYTAPFVGLGWLLLCFATPSTTAHVIEINTLNILAAPLKGLGQVMFLGHPLAGAMIATGLLIADRRAFCWALLASVAGMGWSMLNHDFYTALIGLGGYNAVLAALAFSSQRQKPWLPLIGIASALLLTPVFAAIGLPTLTAPFILSCWLIRTVVQMLGKPPVTRAPCTLEENQPRLR